MALQATDLFVVQRQVGGTPLLKTTAAELNTYISKDLQGVLLAGNVATLGATFGGDVTVGDSSNANTYISPNGAIYLNYKFAGASTDIFRVKSGGSLENTAFTVDQYGAVTTAGKVESGFDDNTSEGVRLDPAGIVNIRRDTGTSTAIGVFSGGVASASTQTVEITAGGSITAAGRVRVDTLESSDNVSLYTGVKPANKTNNYGFAITNSANGNLISGLAADGSITAASTIKTEGTGSVFIGSNYTGADDPSNVSNFVGSYNGTANFYVRADGSITAASNILVGDNSASASSTGGYIYSTRYIDAANVGSAALNGQAADGDLASLSIIDRSSGSGVETVVIKPTGSASFAGALEAASIDGGTY